MIVTIAALFGSRKSQPHYIKYKMLKKYGFSYKFYLKYNINGVILLEGKKFASRFIKFGWEKNLKSYIYT